MNINEAKVIVTGGTSGIGYEIAKLLSSHGAQVVICGRNAATVATITNELNIHGIVADMAKEEDVIKLIDFAKEKLGGLNVLINNAGIGYMAPLTEISTDDFTRVWETNVRGLFVAGREAAKHFIAQKSGNIINIGSTAGLRGFANGSAYVATKFAVSGLTECWRAELRQHNIRVMQINPSEVVTDFGKKLGYEHKNEERKLKGTEIAHVALAMLSMNDVGFLPEVSVWATNP